MSNDDVDRARALESIASGDAVADRAEEAMRLAAPFIERHEGFRGKAYWDKIGRRWTVGHGHTQIKDAVTGKMRDVVRGDIIDRSESSALLRRRLRQNAASMYRNLKWTRTLSPRALAALYDVAYNAGSGSLSESRSPSLNRGMNAPGADRDAVVWRELPSYRTSGGKVIRGLVNRRKDAIAAFGPSSLASR